MEQLLTNNELKLIVPKQRPPKSEKRKSVKEYIRWDNYNERGASLLKFRNVDFWYHNNRRLLNLFVIITSQMEQRWNRKLYIFRGDNEILDKNFLQQKKKMIVLQRLFQKMKEKRIYKEGADDNKSNIYRSHAHYIFQPQSTCIIEFNLCILKHFVDGQLSYYCLLSTNQSRHDNFSIKKFR